MATPGKIVPVMITPFNDQEGSLCVQYQGSLIFTSLPE